MIKSDKLAPPKTAKPKRVKIADMDLDTLYEQEKMTPTVIKTILSKEDFSQIRARYCQKACKIPAGDRYPNLVEICHEPVDILIVQSMRAPSERYKTAGQINEILNRQILYICRQVFPEGVTFRLANLVQCPNRSDDDRVLKLTQVQMMSCAPYLHEEIRRSKPKVIISTSTEVTKALGLKDSNYNNRGEFRLSNIPGVPPTPVIMTLHVKVLNMIRQNASGKMYGADFYPVIERDFGKAIGIMQGRIPVGDNRAYIENIIRRNVVVAKTLQEVRDFRDTLLGLPERHIISWDTETTSLDPFSPDARLLTTQFGFRDTDGTVRALVVPLWHRDNKDYDPDAAWDIIKDVLLGPHPKVGHNIKFDIVFTEVTTGVRVQGLIFDTMLQMHSINSGIQGNYSLKDCPWDWIPELGLGGYEDLLDETLDPVEIKRLVDLEKAEGSEPDEEEDQ